MNFEEKVSNQTFALIILVLLGLAERVLSCAMQLKSKVDVLARVGSCPRGRNRW